MNFIINIYGKSNQKSENNSIILTSDDWDDYGFVTKFHMSYKKDDILNPIGEIKIGLIGQKPKQSNQSSLSYKEKTYLLIPNNFTQLKSNFFSIGQSPEYYEALNDLFGETAKDILRSLNDIAVQPDASKYDNEEVYKVSLLRSVDEWVIENQYKPIIDGRSKLTDFEFLFKHKNAIFKYKVIAKSTPPTNIHALIGRNGVGKTTVLNEMFETLLNNNTLGHFESLVRSRYSFFSPTATTMNSDYFSKVIYISYSIFGSYVPNCNNSEKFSYLGLKGIKEVKEEKEFYIKNLDDLSGEISKSFSKIRSSKSLKDIFNKILEYFYSSYEDTIISDIKEHLKVRNEDTEIAVPFNFASLSSGHAIVLLIIVNLIANVTEKTLILFDEPETHLHPPLLSALVRAINDILIQRNGICIFATHSPVVIQEIPKSCVQIIRRTGENLNISALEIESFGENVSSLTHEVFGLEVKSTGFYNILKKDFESTKSVETVINNYKSQLGSEALSLLYLLKSNEKLDVKGLDDLEVRGLDD